MKFAPRLPLLFVTFLSACGSSPPQAAQSDANLAPVPVETSVDESSPRLPRGVIVRPAFDTVKGELSAGTAFFVSIPGHAHPIGVTAHHLFGPAGGLEREVQATELGQFVRGAYYFEIDPGGDKPYQAGPIVVLPSAGHAKKPADRSSDVAAFDAPARLAPRALRLAPQNAKPGEDVWLVAEVLGGKSASKRLHRARVVTSEPRLLVYQFEDTTLELRATSGAPVVNARGEVVGVNLAGGPEGDALFGLANPVESVTARLMEGLADRTTCAAALAKYVEGWRAKGTPPELTAGEHAAVLNKGSYLAPCGVPRSMVVNVCAAVQDGHAIGVTVTTSPPDLTVASCVAGQLSTLSFPASPLLDVTTTIFE